jgi:hypothetical protein
MNATLKWKLVVGFILAFLAGCATGAFFAASHSHHLHLAHHRYSLADRMRNRIQAQLDLTPAQSEKIGPIFDQAATELQQRRALEIAPAALPPLEIDPSRAKTALKGLLEVCLTCHRLDEDEAAMRPVVSSRSMLTAAVFSHKPHTNQVACDSCHTVAKSRAGVDVNLPSIRSCETCHDAARARADCVSCHTYHPQSAAELVRASR